jgi:flagellar basal-body rod modification protein FlgD
MVTSVSNADSFSALNSASNATQTKNEAGSADRFLKLLVTQMQNQDPLNPMDNAQITSQMAQINTVNGIEQLNTTVEGLNTQFVQLQALSGASLVGRDITLAGNKLVVDGGKAVGGFELAGTAGAVKVEVLNPAGRVVDTIELGAQNSGRHAFEWTAANVPDTAAGGSPHSFRITATQGGVAVPSTSLMRDRVQAIHTSGTSLMLETANNGTVAYRDVQAVN